MCVYYLIASTYFGPASAQWLQLLGREGCSCLQFSKQLLNDDPTNRHPSDIVLKNTKKKRNQKTRAKMPLDIVRERTQL